MGWGFQIPLRFPGRLGMDTLDYLLEHSLQKIVWELPIHLDWKSTVAALPGGDTYPGAMRLGFGWVAGACEMKTNGKVWVPSMLDLDCLSGVSTEVLVGDHVPGSLIGYSTANLPARGDPFRAVIMVVGSG